MKLTQPVKDRSADFQICATGWPREEHDIRTDFHSHQAIKITTEQIMKTTQTLRTAYCALLITLLLGMGAFNSDAQFNSGSDGSYGPMNITTTTTLVLPTNGIFNCTTITVASNATLRFTNNSLNTPVYLLATSNVVVNGTIDVSGKAGTSLGGDGGPGGFAGGYPGVSMLPFIVRPAGDGYGPGAGRAGTSTSQQSNTNQAGHAAYGSPSSSHITAGNGATYVVPCLFPFSAAQEAAEVP